MEADTGMASSRRMAPSNAGPGAEGTGGHRLLAACVFAAAAPVTHTAVVHHGFGIRPTLVAVVFLLAWAVLFRHARGSAPAPGPLVALSVGVGALTAFAGGPPAGVWPAAALVACVAATVGVRGLVRPLALRWSPVPLGLLLLSVALTMDDHRRWREAGFASFLAAVICAVVLGRMGEFVEQRADRWFPVERGWSRPALLVLHAAAGLLVLHTGFFAVGLARGAPFGYSAWREGFGGRGPFKNAVAIAGPIVIPAAILVVGAAVTLMGRRSLARVSVGVLGLVLLSTVSLLLGLWLVPDGLV